jgi:hypothetical protein
MEGVMKLGYIVVAVLIASLARAQTTYLWDGWNDGDADGWVEASGNVTYEVTDSLTYRFSYSGSGDEEGISYWGMMMPDPDYTVLSEFTGHDNTSHIGFDARFDAVSTKWSYTVYVNYLTDQFFIAKYTPGFEVLVTMYYDFVYGQHYCMKFGVYGTSLMAKVWEYGESEPGWLIQTTDVDINDPYYVGLECFTNPSGSFAGDFYYIMVADSIPDVLEQTTWGDIKASF